MVFSAAGKRGEEARKAAELFTTGCDKEVFVKEYRDGFLPYSGVQVKDFFEELKGRVNPDVIFTHWQGDAHQDHRLICELTWNTFRNHLILEYEIPKYDGDMGRPNVFVPLEEPVYLKKVDKLYEAFESQRSKPWFERETVPGADETSWNGIERTQWLCRGLLRAQNGDQFRCLKKSAYGQRS